MDSYSIPSIGSVLLFLDGSPITAEELRAHPRVDELEFSVVSVTSQLHLIFFTFK